MLTQERLYAIKKTKKVRKKLDKEVSWKKDEIRIQDSTKSRGNKESYSYIWDKAMEMI